MVEMKQKSRISRSRWGLGLISLAVVFAAAPTWGQSTVDRIRRRTGVDTGEITEVSALAVSISKSGIESKVPVEEIRGIQFAGEPAEFAAARSAIDRGRYADARTALQKVERDSVQRPEVVAELDFLLLDSETRMAEAGEGDLGAAIRVAQEFLATHRNSYHVSTAIERLGDVYLANGQREEAQAQYAKLAKAPAPYFQALSAVKLGQLLQLDDKHDQALAEFDRAIAAAGDNPAAQPMVLDATLHRAVSRSATGAVDAATADLKSIIEKADAENIEHLATAYNALGDCYLAGEMPKAARDAYLHVDLLFSAAADEHAKALFELSKLWDDLGQPQRAREAREKLAQEYPHSSWARKLGSP